MIKALRPTTDEERAAQIAQDKILLARPDMHQHDEPDNDSRWNVLATVFWFYVIVGLLIGAWIAWGAWE